jgi:hypothetical protein
VSLDVRVATGSRLELRFGSGSPLVLSRGPVGVPTLTAGSSSYALALESGWLGGGWRHIEATSTRLAVDGRSFPFSTGGATTMTFHVTRGRADIKALIISADRNSLLLHRLAELHARIPTGHFPIGADTSDQIHYGSTYWTSGFWPGALWQAAALVQPGGGLFAGWALSTTIAHFGHERFDTHDVGFMYGQSSLAAWDALCHSGRAHSRMTRARPARARPDAESRMTRAPADPARPDAERPAGPSASARLCSRLKRSVIAAADELMALAASNPGSGTIPTNSTGPDADTIIDSTMNIAILPWATRVTGNPAYARLASHHAHVVASLLVRPDGSTAQSVHFDRASGRVLLIHTHQGLSNSSTWSRGQAWAVYGFAQAASDLHDRGLLRVAERVATYVASHLPAGGIPLWDYDAPAGAPVDVSAGVITAAGLLHVAAACHAIPGVCTDPGRWVPLARRMLAAALTRASGQPPLGFLGSQVLNERGRGCWCDGGELSFGLTYALEGLRLEQGAGRS